MLDNWSFFYGIYNLEGNLSSYQANKIKNGFIAAGSENYGYFRLNMSSRYVGEGKLNGLTLTGYIIGSILIPIIGPLTLPVGSYQYSLNTSVEILDVNKNVIKGYTSSTTFEGAESIHERDYTMVTEGKFRELLRTCLNAAARDADEINALLRAAKYPPPPSLAETVSGAFSKLTTSGRIPQGSRIALLAARPNMDEAISATRLLEEVFLNSKKYRIVDRSNLDAVFSEFALRKSILTEENAVQIGVMLSCDFIIMGDISNRTLNFRVLSVGTGEVVASFTATYA